MISLLSAPLPLSVCSVPSEQGSALSVCIVSKVPDKQYQKLHRETADRSVPFRGSSVRLIQLHLPFFFNHAKQIMKKQMPYTVVIGGGHADQVRFVFGRCERNSASGECGSSQAGGDNRKGADAAAVEVSDAAEQHTGHNTFGAKPRR